MRRKLIILALILTLAVFALISLYHLAYYNKIYPRVFVAGREVSNQSLSQARRLVAAKIPEPLPQLELTFGNQVWPLDLTGLSIIFQPEAAAQQAFLFGRSQGAWQDFLAKWRHWRHPAELRLIHSLDEARLANALGIITGAVEEPALLPALELSAAGQIKLLPGKNGRIVNSDRLNRLIRDRLGRLDFSPLPLPIELINTGTSPERLADAQARAETLKHRRLILTAENRQISVEKQELINLIGFDADWNGAEIASLSARLAGQINRPFQNAVFQFDGTKAVEFKPALDGLTLDEPAGQQLVTGLLEKLINEEATEQAAALPVTVTPPSITTGSVNNLGIKELLGKGESTFFGSIAGRKHNIALAAGRLNGLVVAPGETFSFNQAVGDVSRATGFQSAYIIQNGRTVLGDGGGVCQVSSTLFRAVLNAGLEIMERRAHSYRVSYYEQNSSPGFDATVFSPNVDFKFKNDTANHILIQAAADLANSYLKFELYGTSDGRKISLTNARLWAQTPPPPPLYQDDPTLPAGTIKQVDWAAWGGKAAFDWTVEHGGEILRQKTFYSAYQPWQAIFLRGVGGI